jgi:hypothetical protein
MPFGLIRKIFLLVAILIAGLAAHAQNDPFGRIIQQQQQQMQQQQQQMQQQIQRAQQQAMYAQGIQEPTEFYWKGSYGRGIGTVVDTCPAGKIQRGGLCYDSCRAGYSDNGTLTCATDCPPGYSDRGAICHYDGTGSYSPVHWDNCAARAPGWLGGGCIGGTVEDGCRDGYTKRASVCYYERVPAGMSGTGMDPTKGTYSDRPPVGLTCGGGKQYQDTLCYTPCRSGMEGKGPVCWTAVPSGWVDCGFGYAKDQTSCALVVTDQVVSVLSLVKDACTMTQFPGVSQACAMGGTKYMQAKAMTKLMAGKSVTALTNAAEMAAASQKAQRILTAMQNGAPVVARLVQKFGAPIRGLAGAGIAKLPEFGDAMIKSGEEFVAMTPDLYTLSKNLHAAADQPPVALTGTPMEMAFKAVRDISSFYSMGVALSTLTIPGFETSPMGQGMVASADILGTVAAYLYTQPGQ